VCVCVCVCVHVCVRMYHHLIKYPARLLISNTVQNVTNLFRSLVYAMSLLPTSRRIHDR